MSKTKYIAVLLAGIISAAGLTACLKANGSQMNAADTAGNETLSLEMEMDANYSDSDPFENGRLFCVSEDMESLNAEVSFQMDGEHGMVEIKDRDADQVLWSNAWDGSVDSDTHAILLTDLKKEKEYDVRFTGTKINHVVVNVTFESGLVREKERPSKQASN